jgi:hypothetical protein
MVPDEARERPGYLNLAVRTPVGPKSSNFILLHSKVMYTR